MEIRLQQGRGLRTVEAGEMPRLSVAAKLAYKEVCWHWILTGDSEPMRKWAEENKGAKE